MEKLIESFLDTKYHEPFIIKGLPFIKETELYVKSGENILSYGFVRKGDLYSYIDWNVPTITLNEILPYFDENIGSLEKIILRWVKDKFVEKGHNIHDPNIVRQLCR